eukprot:116068_1
MYIDESKDEKEESKEMKQETKEEKMKEESKEETNTNNINMSYEEYKEMIRLKKEQIINKNKENIRDKHPTETMTEDQIEKIKFIFDTPSIELGKLCSSGNIDEIEKIIVEKGVSLKSDNEFNTSSGDHYIYEREPLLIVAILSLNLEMFNYILKFKPTIVCDAEENSFRDNDIRSIQGDNAFFTIAHLCIQHDIIQNIENHAILSIMFDDLLKHTTMEDFKIGHKIHLYTNNEARGKMKLSKSDFTATTILIELCRFLNTKNNSDYINALLVQSLLTYFKISQTLSIS